MLLPYQKIIKQLLGKSFSNFVTNPKLLTVSQLKSRLSSSLVLGALILAGYAGNYSNLSLFFGVDFLFGSIAVLIVVCLYGIGWGTIAAVIAGSHTFFLWGHPYAAVILTLEAFLVGWGLRRRHQNLLLLDGFYWVLIGMPLVWLFYGVVMGVQVQSVLLVMLKQCINGIFNALIATLLLTYLPIYRRVARPKAVRTLSLQQILFNVLIAFVFFPALTLMVLHSRSALSNIETTIQAKLHQESTYVVVQMRSWHEQSLNALKQLAEVAVRSDMAPSTALQDSTELMQHTVPGFHQLLVVNEMGQAIASYPPVNPTITNSAAWKALNLTQPKITPELGITSNESSSPMLIQTMPIKRNARVIGTVVSKSQLKFIDQLLESLIYKQELEITLIDRQGRVIASTRSNRPTLQAFDPQQGGEIRAVKDNVYQWLPVGKMPIMVRWKNSFYVQRVPASKDLPWTVIVEAPTGPHFSYLQKLYIKSLAIVLLIAVLALLLANTLSRRLTKPIRQLAIVTTDVPDKFLNQKANGLQQHTNAIPWPQSWVTEINALVDNFKCMADTLEQKFQEIKSAKEQLEQRVQERTRELSVANRELETEVVERKRVAESLQQSETLLRWQTQKLENALYKLQNTQAQLVQTEKMSSLGQLVAGVAHEINNPVSFIYGNLIHAKSFTQDLLRLVQLYQQQYPTPTATIQEEIEAIDLEFLRDDLPKLLDSMQVGAERIHEIVQSLRNFSRLDEAEMKAVDIHQGVDSTLMILQHRLKGKGQHLGIEVIKEYGNLPLVECYPGELNQVFMNILVNAIDAIAFRLLADSKRAVANANEALEDLNDERELTQPDIAQVEGAENLLVTTLKTCKLLRLEDRVQPTKLQPTTPWIRIRTEVLKRDWVAIRIANNGPSITEEVSSKLFDPFFTTKPVGQGSGLGLSISYQIVVERHGGKLYCISEPQQGTEFIIEIPRQQSMYQTVTKHTIV